jgi:hypothetical protein
VQLANFGHGCWRHLVRTCNVLFQILLLDNAGRLDLTDDAGTRLALQRNSKSVHRACLFKTLGLCRSCSEDSHKVESHANHDIFTDSPPAQIHIKPTAYFRAFRVHAPPIFTRSTQLSNLQQMAAHGRHCGCGMDSRLDRYHHDRSISYSKRRTTLGQLCTRELRHNLLWLGQFTFFIGLLPAAYCFSRIRMISSYN